MSARRRRRHEAASEREGPDERWMASYLDMVTVLMCMFIVLFAMSTVDKEKFEALSASLATGFGQTPSEQIDVSEGVVVPVDLVDDEGESFADTPLDAAIEEFDDLSALRDRLRDALAANGLESTATFRIDDAGLTVGLVSAETMFGTNSTQLSDRAVAVLDALGGVLVEVSNQISIEGHADYRTSAAPYATNWELSSGRATQVLRYLVEARGLAAGAVRAVGFGDTRPIAQGVTDAELAQNRRVDIVILSDADEDVRRLLPELAQAPPVP